MTTNTKTLENLLKKQKEVYALTKELSTYVALEELGINKVDIVGRRPIQKHYVSGRWIYCDEFCQVKLKDGTEHIVPRHLIYT